MGPVSAWTKFPPAPYSRPFIDQPHIRHDLPFHTSVSPQIHPITIFRNSSTRPYRLRSILVARFFLNLRHVFFRKDRAGPESLSSFNIRIPTITSEDLVGNLGAPLRSPFASGPHASSSSYAPLPSGPSEIPTGIAAGSSLRQRKKHPNKGKARADPLLDWDVDDLDDEDLEDTEITSREPMLVGLEIYPDVREGEGSRGPVWRRGFDEVGEEIIPLMDRDGENSAAQTPMRSMHSEGEGDRNSLPPNRQPSKSTVDETDALLVGEDENDEEDPDGYSRDPMRSSLASTVNSEVQEVSPRRVSYFS